jgi:hypothetical protein
MRFSIILLAFVIAIFGYATSAQAQATRTWVSGVGDDANPCSRTAPCKTFAGAISKTAASGEINVLDPGGFGGVTITKAITIRSDYIEAGVLVAGTNGIVVAAGATDQVVLEGLDIDGTASGLNGISVTSGAGVFVIRCAIRRFTQSGISFTSSTTNSRIFVMDSIITLNNGGINIQGNGTANLATVQNTSIISNTAFAVQANGAGNQISFVNSQLRNSPQGLNLLNGATATSIGPSNFLAGTGAFSSTIPYQ